MSKTKNGERAPKRNTRALVEKLHAASDALIVQAYAVVGAEAGDDTAKEEAELRVLALAYADAVEALS